MRLPVQSSNVMPSSIGAGVQPSLGGCVSATIQNGSVCFNLPVLGSKCFYVSNSLPNGASASACVDVSIFPPKACVTVTALGQQIAHECVGI